MTRTELNLNAGAYIDAEHWIMAGQRRPNQSANWRKPEYHKHSQSSRCAFDIKNAFHK